MEAGNRTQLDSMNLSNGNGKALFKKIYCSLPPYSWGDFCDNLTKRYTESIRYEKFQKLDAPLKIDRKGSTLKELYRIYCGLKRAVDEGRDSIWKAVWDLDGVSPLFRVPSCVIFAAPTDPRTREWRLSRILKSFNIQFNQQKLSAREFRREKLE